MNKNLPEKLYMYTVLVHTIHFIIHRPVHVLFDGIQDLPCAELSLVSIPRGDDTYSASTVGDLNLAESTNPGMRFQVVPGPS